MNIGKVMKNATVIFASTAAGVVAFKKGCEFAEKTIPSIATKIHLTKTVASAMRSVDDDDEYYDEDDEE